MSSDRSSFSNKLGFVLAAAGSAVGLGNIWRFPYLAAKYGGGAFLLVYFLLSMVLGFSLMVAEVAIGRRTGKSAIEAFGALDKRFSFLGLLASFVPALILPYYSVIGGWVMKYFKEFLMGDSSSLARDDYFYSYISTVKEPLVWFLIFIGLTTLVVLLGVEGGIEKVSKFMMPLLVFLTLAIAVYTVVSMDSAWEGVAYYLTPDLSNFSVMTVVSALGQLFYSMSLAMGVMITFGSYMKKDISISKAVKQIELFDIAVAFLSGLMIIPAVFAFFGGEESALGQGEGLMFVTLPRLFLDMPGSRVIGAAFFFMVMLAALTSSIALMETIVSIFMDKMKLDRKGACLVVLGISLALGIPASLGYSLLSDFRVLGMQLLEFFDFFSNNIMMPFIALITAVFVGWFIGPRVVVEEVELGGAIKREKMFSFVIRYVAPIAIFIILLSSVLSAFGVISI